MTIVIAGEDLKRGDPLIIRGEKAFKANPFRWKRIPADEGGYLYACAAEFCRAGVVVGRDPDGHWYFTTKWKESVDPYPTAKSAKKAAEIHISL